MTLAVISSDVTANQIAERERARNLGICERDCAGLFVNRSTAHIVARCLPVAAANKSDQVQRLRHLPRNNRIGLLPFLDFRIFLMTGSDSYPRAVTIIVYRD